MYKACEKKVTVTYLEDKISRGTSIWVATVTCESSCTFLQRLLEHGFLLGQRDNGEMLSWTTRASSKGAGRDAAAKQALEALKIPIGNRR